MVYDVDVVAVPAQAVVTLRGRAPLSEMGRLQARLRDLVAQAGLQPAGPMTARFYDDGPEGDVNFAVTIAVQPGPDGSVPDRVGEAAGEWLPQHHVLEAVHRGPHRHMGDAWAAVREACEALGYTQAGPVTEIYEVDRSSGASPDDYVTRIRLPYAR